MLRELAVERFRFSCHHCGHVWNDEYDVQHVDDGHGVTWEYYSLDGVPVPAPTAPGTVTCARCGAGRVSVELVAVREVPLVEAPDEAAGRPRQPVDAGRTATGGQMPSERGASPARGSR